MIRFCFSVVCGVLALSACVDSTYIADPNADAAVEHHPTVDAGTQDLLFGDRPTADAAEHDASVPDTPVSDSLPFDTAALDTAALDTGEADSSLPDSAAPDAGAPDTTAPDTTAPDTAAPDTSAPDSSVPDTSRPDTSRPDTAIPDTSEPEDAGITTVELPPFADSWLRQGSPDSPGGDSPELAVGYCTAGSNGNMRIWLRFDLSALPQGASILAAGVELYFHTHWGGQDYLVRHSAVDSWDENSLTWNSQPAYGPEVLDTVAAFSEDNGWKGWDVTAAVLQELGGDGELSLVIEGETMSPADDEEHWAYSKEHTEPELAPRLVVSYQIP